MKYMKLSLLCAIALMIQVHVFAQNNYEWKTSKSGDFPYKYVTNDPSNSRYYTLKNGLSVILSVSKEKPRIQTYIAVKAGSKTDPADHTGLAHYLEHLLFKGTSKFGSLDWAKEKPLLDKITDLYEKYNHTTDEAKRKEIYAVIDKTSGEAAKFAIANEYDKMMTNMGAEGTNAFTSFEQTVYTEDIPANNIDKFLKVQSERFRDPVFRIFHTELEAVYEEKNRGLDNDGSKEFEKMFTAMFPNNNYGKQTTIGTIEHLKNPSIVAIRNYFDTYYVPNNMGIVMVGDFNPDELIVKINEAFSFMKTKEIPVYQAGVEKPISAPIIADVIGPNPENIMLGYRFPGAKDKDARILNLVGDILTNGAAGLIDLNLLKKQKLLSAFAFPYVLKDYSVLLLQGTPKSGQSLEEVKTLLLGEIEKLKKSDFPDDLISSIVNNNKVTTLRETEDYSSVAEALMENFTSETDWKEKVAYVNDISKLTKNDIVEFANKYFNDQNYVAIFKRKGEDPNKVKVDKPSITPVSVNREAESPFLKAVNSMPETTIHPQWADYDKEILRASLGGVEILSVPNKTNALFSLAYFFEVGKWNNKLIPLAAQYLQFLGTKDKSSAQFSKDFYKIASSFDVSAGDEETTISIKGLQENLVASVQLIEDLVRNCVADQEAFKSFIDGLKKSRADAKLNKSAIASGLRSYATYGKENPFNNQLTEEELTALKPEDLVSIIHNMFGFKHKILYYGTQTASQLSSTLKPLHLIASDLKTFPIAKKYQYVTTDKNKVLFAQYDMVQAEVYWQRNEGKFQVALLPSITVFNNYFGGGMGSIVFQTIRESKALAYSTYAYFQSANKKDNQNAAIAYVGTQADKFKDAVVGMNELLNVLPESEKALSTAKESTMKSIASERITKMDIINSYFKAQKLGLKSDIRKTIYEKTPAISLADLKAFHAKQWSQQPYNYCIVADQKRLKKEDMEKLGEVKELSLKEIFGY